MAPRNEIVFEAIVRMRCKLYQAAVYEPRLKRSLVKLVSHCRFVVHAAETFEARVIVLIAPPRTIIPNRYTVVFEDNSMARDRAFYVPGAAAQSWNVVRTRFLHQPLHVHQRVKRLALTSASCCQSCV